MNSASSKYYERLLLGLAGIFVVLAIIGGVKNYSPVPFRDMWNGYLGFFVKASEGDVAIWWSQFNEHRIVFARILFWLDIRFFNGSIVFLIAVNYILSAATLTCFFYILRIALPGEENHKLRIIILSVICILTFSWIQQGNLSWGFQSQFFLAQLFPLLAFYLLYLADASKKHAALLYLMSAVIGIACAGTMANGILALPLMVVMAAVLRMGWPKVLGLLILSALVLFAYFSDYQQTSIHGSMREELTAHPIEILQYLLLYLGGPVYYMTGERSYPLAQLAGCFLIGSTVFFAYKATQEIKKNTLQISLLIFILYIGGTALGTAGGRLKLGLETALISRYTTPSLMAWSALLILYASYLRQKIIRSRSALVALLLVPVLLLPYQFKALKNKDDDSFEHMVAALAIELGVRDQVQVETVFYSPDYVFTLSKIPIERGLSIFGNEVIKNARNDLGKLVTSSSNVPCIGAIDEIAAVDGDSRYVRVSGWIFAPSAGRSPKSVFFRDPHNKVVGYAIAGRSRHDIKASVYKNADRSGFKGYILASSATGQLLVEGKAPDCHLKQKRDE